jgi:hypothetical protein
MIRASLRDCEQNMWLAMEGGMMVWCAPAVTKVFTRADCLLTHSAGADLRGEGLVKHGLNHRQFCRLARWPTLS